MSKSNTNGRALEYCIAKHLHQNNSNSNFTSRAKKNQERDEPKYESLKDSMKKYYNGSSLKINNWLDNGFKISSSSFTIDRLTDSEAKKGNPADISITMNSGETINLSIKHNHTASKHQRPASLAQQMGIPKKSNSDLKYRLEHKRICNIFSEKANQLDPDTNLFNSIKSLDNKFIDKHLYDPICGHVTQFLQDNCKGNSVQEFFSFIVGKNDFYKVIVTSTVVEVIDYKSIPKPTEVVVEQESESYIKLLFNNNWNFLMRIHNASSRIDGCEGNGCSLKFDTQLTKSNLTTIKL